MLEERRGSRANGRDRGGFKNMALWNRAGTGLLLAGGLGLAVLMVSLLVGNGSSEPLDSCGTRVCADANVDEVAVFLERGDWDDFRRGIESVVRAGRAVDRVARRFDRLGDADPPPARAVFLVENARSDRGARRGPPLGRAIEAAVGDRWREQHGDHRRVGRRLARRESRRQATRTRASYAVGDGRRSRLADRLYENGRLRASSCWTFTPVGRSDFVWTTAGWPNRPRVASSPASLIDLPSA